MKTFCKQAAHRHSHVLNLAKLELSSKPVFTPPLTLNAEKASFSYVFRSVTLISPLPLPKL